MLRGLPVLLLAVSTASAAPVYESHEPRLLLEAPSEAVVGERVTVGVLFQDRWGPEGPEVSSGVEHVGRFEVSSSDPEAELDRRLTIPAGARGRETLDVVFRTPGLQSIAMVGPGGATGRSNPVRVLPDAPPERVYWGDLHGHLHTPGGGHAGLLPLDEYRRILEEGLDWAENVSRLDFAAFTPHLQTAGGLARRAGRDGTPWEVLQEVVEKRNRPGGFTVFPGFEWQGDEGDHCVLYPGPGPIDAPGDLVALCDATLRRGGIVTAHAIYLPSEFRVSSSALAGVEVTRDSKSTEFLGEAAIRSGQMPAFLGCSDTHGGALGATSLTGLRASGRSRVEVLRAIRERRTWATNGERILLDFTVDGSGPLPRVEVRGVATAPIDRIEIYRNGRLVTDARGFDASLEFEFVREDDDLLRAECLAGPVVYHARVVQTSTNRYDPAQRDIAVSSPQALLPTAQQFDAAYLAGGGSAAAPGLTLVRVREAWNALGPVPGQPPRAHPPADAPVPEWTRQDRDPVEAAIKDLARLATKDPVLLPLSNLLNAVPKVADALRSVQDARHRLPGTTGGSVREVTRAAQERVAAAEGSLAGAGRDELAAAWFAVDALRDRSSRLVEETADAMAHGAGVTFAVGDREPRSDWSLPADARVWSQVPAVTRRSSELRDARYEAMGYTAPRDRSNERQAAVRLRVVAEGDVRGARLTDAAGTWEQTFERSRSGWVSVLPAGRIPEAQDPPLVLHFDPPAIVQRIFVERPDGSRLRPGGRVTSFRATREGLALRAALTVVGAAVSVELLRDGPQGLHAVWAGRLEPGEHALAFPVEPDGSPGAVTLRWGFGGWRREAGQELSGHEVARFQGLGALRDGRAVVALRETMMLVDWERGEAFPIDYPDGHRHAPDREFCFVDRGDGTALVRGADGPSGGWSADLDVEAGTWSEEPAGPEAGTVVAAGPGAIAWLRGNALHVRSGDGETTDALDATGRLLGLDSSGQPIVRLPSGDALRATRGGGIRGRVPGQVLAADATGTVLRLDRLNARHAELATGFTVDRVFVKGPRDGPWPIDLPTSPAGETPVEIVATADNSLIVRGGSTRWRSLPEHAWWGATVEIWRPVWAGEIRVEAP
jgi:hypothetical protein